MILDMGPMGHLHGTTYYMGSLVDNPHNRRDNVDIGLPPGLNLASPGGSDQIVLCCDCEHLMCVSTKAYMQSAQLGIEVICRLCVIIRQAAGALLTVLGPV